jgi:hypothetical protein
MNRDTGTGNRRDRVVVWVFVVLAVLLTALAWGGNSVASILRGLR